MQCSKPKSRRWRSSEMPDWLRLSGTVENKKVSVLIEQLFFQTMKGKGKRRFENARSWHSQRVLQTLIFGWRSKESSFILAAVLASQIKTNSNRRNVLMSLKQSLKLKETMCKTIYGGLKPRRTRCAGDWISMTRLRSREIEIATQMISWRLGGPGRTGLASTGVTLGNSE
jgi:hypothetical protein